MTLELNQRMVKLDPYRVELPKWHPKRIAMKVYVSLLERATWPFYRRTQLPLQEIVSLPAVNWDATAPMSVTPIQAAYLFKALEYTESLNGVAVEVGAFQGRTTAKLATHTHRPVIAVDPYYEGWPPATEALALFYANTAKCNNVKLERKSSGQAAREWEYGQISFLFIDSQHDFANTCFDFNTWRPLTCPNALIAFHDVDNFACRGTRVAAWFAARKLPVWAHIDNLLILRNAVI